MAENLREKYDVATENILTFREALQYYLLTEQKDNIAQHPREIPEEEVLNLFNHPNRLPVATLNFIRLMNQIFDGDIDDILNLNMPANLEKSFVKQRLDQKEIFKKKKLQIIQNFLKNLEMFFQKFFETFSFLDAIELRYKHENEKIQEELAMLDEDEARQFSDIEKGMEKIGEHLKEIRGKLEDNKLESMNQLEDIRREIERDNNEVTSLKLRFRERLRNLRRFWNRNLENAVETTTHVPTGMIAGTVRAAGSAASVVSSAAGVASTVVAGTAAAVTTIRNAVDAVIHGEEEEEFWPGGFDDDGAAINNDPDD